jgi:hypothetical protein
MAYNAVSVGTTATLICAGNTKRQELTIVNASTSVDIFVGPDDSISAANGIPLYAQQRNDRWKGPGGSWLGDVYGITASGTADIRYWEVER